MTIHNPNSRLEAFCDGVFAIALTLLVIDIKIPHGMAINNTEEFWRNLQHIIPSMLAFLLSFIIILITWVNHHNCFTLINKSSASFIYANGLLLLTVVIVPFPTSLVGEHLLTNHAAPAVVLYNAVLALQALGWILLCGTITKHHLYNNEKSYHSIRRNGQFGYFACVLYSLCAIVAIWFPLTIDILTTISWLFWLIYGINIKYAESSQN